jgi:hypothetical protein
MTRLRLIDALKDFGPPPASRPETHAPDHAAAVQPARVDPAALLADAVAEAEARATRSANAEWEARMAAERELHAVEIEHLTRRFGAEAGKTVLERMDVLERDLTAHAGAAIARILGTLMTDTLRQRSVDSLASTLLAAARDAETLRVEVRGPQSLFEALDKALGGRIADVVYTEGDGFDLTVSFDETVFETRIGEWMASLSEILA